MLRAEIAELEDYGRLNSLTLNPRVLEWSSEEDEADARASRHDQLCSKVRRDDRTAGRGKHYMEKWY